MKKSFLLTQFRVETLNFDFDNYASKGSTVYPVRKFHRNMAAIQAGAMPGPSQALPIAGKIMGIVR